MPNPINWRPNLKRLIDGVSILNLKRLIDGVFILVTVLLILISLAGYLGEFNQYLELTSHFKLQYLIVSFCPFFFFLLRRQQLGLSLSLFCLLFNLLDVAPWYLPQSFINSSQIQGQKIRVLQSNINKFNNQYSQLISLVREESPDIAVFLEVGIVGSKEFEVLQDILPYSKAGQDKDFRDGTLIYSKLPLENASVKSLGGGRVSILADLKIQGQTIPLITSHLSQALEKSYYEKQNKQLEAVTDYVAKLKNPLVVGDFNLTMWSPYYKYFVSKTGLRNARAGFGILPTWPTFRPLLSIPIDHCFVGRDIKVLKSRTGRPVGSDHLPLITDLLIPGKNKVK